MIDPKILFQLGTYGPLGIMVIFLFLLLLKQQRDHQRTVETERQRTEKLTEKVIELSQASIRADTQHTETLNAMTKVLDSVDRRLS